MGIHYSQEIIEEILNRNDIVSVVSEYVKLVRKGSSSNYLWACCPFHNEKTPSFSVTPSKQIFYCYGCQKGGNVIHFVSMAENISYFDAVRLLAERSGIDLPEGNDEKEIERARIRKEIIEVNTQAARFFRDNLFNSREGMDYFIKRGVCGRIIKSFGLGYSLNEWDSLYRFLSSKGFSDEILLLSGLVNKDRGGHIIDRYRNRVMFPIFDIMGKVIAFGGRVLDDSRPKYINSPETPAYHKGRHLYAMNFAKKSQNRQLIIVEGYMDVISLHQAGITNAVASLGTALTDSQGRLLKKYCEEVVISYDADGAGQKAAMRGLDILNNMGCRVKVIKVPDGKDPDDFVRKNGPEQFNALVRRGMSLIEYKAEYYKSNIDIESIEGKAQFMESLSAILASIENMVEREMYIKRFSELYGVSEQALAYDVAKRTGEGDVRPPQKDIRVVAAKREREINKSEEEKKISYAEKMLLALICSDNSIYSFVRSKISPKWFIDPENVRISERVFANLDENNETSMAFLLEAAGESGRGDFARISLDDCIFENNHKAAEDIIKKRDELKYSMRRNEIIELMGDPGISKEKRNELNQELREIFSKYK